jgi:lysophospholipase L1-like esterase
MRRIGLLAVATLLLLCGAPAGAQEPDAALVADATRPGTITLGFFGPPGTHVRFFEVGGGGRRQLGEAVVTDDGVAVLLDAVPWRCDRLVREFAAEGTAPDGSPRAGSFSVRTPSCATRWELRAPRRAAPGSRARVRVVDGWRLGGARPSLCVRAPGRTARERCRTVRLARGVPAGAAAVRLDRPGRWRLTLRHHGAAVRRTIAVGRRTAPEPPRPVVLATGDSTMQGVDSFLADLLGERVEVRPEVVVGSGLSGDRAWISRARGQARRVRPAVTVVSIGANEGFPIPAADGRPVECCSADWVVLYERRVRLVLRAYLRGGRGRVAWLTLPDPRDPRRVAITDAVNDAVRRATSGRAGAVLVDLDRAFTPDGYRETMRWRGRTVRVREPDGVHLTAAGTAIAAELVADAIGRVR